MIQKIIATLYKSNWWPAYRKSYVFSTDWFTYRIGEWRKFLAPLKGKKDIKALEIGTYEGRSALWLLENILTDKSARLVCVDSYPGDLKKAEIVFRSNLKKSGLAHKVEIIVEPSETALLNLKEESFDLIYIDGHHEGEQITNDAELSWNLLKPNGILIFDDYKWPPHLAKGMSPQAAIDTFLKKYSNDIHILYIDYQIILRKINITTTSMITI